MTSGIQRVLGRAAAFAIVLAGLAAPAQAQTRTTFVSNLGQGGAVARTIDAGNAIHVAQQFTTGTAPGGYRLAEITINMRQGTSAAASFAIHASNASGEPGSKVVDLNGSIATAGEASLTPASTTVLSASTKYFVLIQLGAVTTRRPAIRIVNSNDEDTGAAAGWSIADTMHARMPGGTWAAGAFNSRSVMIAVKGTLDTVHLPTNVSAAANVPLSIDVTWTAPTTTPSRLALDISRNGRDWSTQRCTHYVINCRVWLAASATSYTHTAHLGGGSTRHYRIFADHSGTSTDGHSLAVSATTSSNPRAFAARAGGSAGETTINVSWTPLAKLGADAVTGYGIEVSTDEGDTWQTLVADTGSTATSYVHGSLSRGALRHYRVRAIAGTRMSGFGRSAWARTTPNDPGKPVLTLTRLRNPGGIIVWRDNEGRALLPVLHELSWPRPDDGGEGELRLTYQFRWDGPATMGKVYRKDQGHDAIELFAQSDTALSFQVRARNEVGENCTGLGTCAGAGPWSDSPSTIENAVKPINRDNAGSLLGRFSGVPGRHDGSTRFRFELRFDQEPEDLSYRTVRDGLLTVNGGSVVQARRVKRNSNLRWEVTVEPAGMEDVSITLPVRECSDANAVCANGEPLAEEVTTTVPIKPFSGSFSGVPAEHAGSGRFTMEFHLSEQPRGLGWQVVRDHLFDVTGGSIERARRIGPVRNKGWELTIAPSGNAEVTLTTRATTSCDHEHAVCTSDGRMLAGGAKTTIGGPATFSAADAEVKEAEGATLDFVVTLSRSKTTAVKVDYATSDGTATAGVDYTATSGTLTFTAGQKKKTIQVRVLNDAHDEGDETVTLTLSNPVGAALDDATATGTISNHDPMPKAWAVRFGRTVGSQVVDALTERLDGAGGSHVTVGGVRLGGGPAVEPEVETDDPFALPAWATTTREAQSQTMTGRDLLLGSSFHLSSVEEGAAHGPAFSAWGRVATGGFETEEDNVTIDGDVTTATLGVDAEWDRLLAGVMLSQSEGDGSYRLDPEHGDDSGTVESSLTGIYPYARIDLNARVSAWALAGAGSGELTLRQKGTRAMPTDLSMRMGAVGVKGALMEPSEASGLALNVKSDAMWVGTKTERTRDMVATEGDVTRLRLILQGERVFAFESGRIFVPSAEVGLRHDGGDAETGTGLEVGAGLRYTAGALTVEGRVRTLAAHEASGYREWGASGAIRLNPSASGRGLTLSIAPEWGRTGSATEQLWGAGDARALSPEGAEFEPSGRLAMDAGYGLGLGHGRGVLTPYAGMTLGEASSRTMRGGAKWQLGPDVAVGVEATRDDAGETSSSGIQLRAALRF